jgi:hypothetical protein
MKIKFIKNEDNIETMIIMNGVEKAYDYLTFIKAIYNNEPFEGYIYSDDISDETKIKLEEMNNKILEIIDSIRTPDELNIDIA